MRFPLHFQMVNENETVVDLKLLSNTQYHHRLPPPESELETNLSVVESDLSGKRFIRSMDQAENFTIKVIIDFVLLCLGEFNDEKKT